MSNRPLRLPRFLWVGPAIAIGGVLALALIRVGPPPEIAIDLDHPGIGAGTRITVTAKEPKRGVGRLEVELRQGERVFPLGLFEARQTPFWSFWAVREREVEVVGEAGARSIPQLVEGEAVLVVRAERAGTWLRRPPDVVVEQALPVRFRPPVVAVLSTLNYATQGGSGVVVYRSSTTPSRDGVMAGERFFPGHELAGATGDLAGARFALFAVPYLLDDSRQIALVVADELGNQSRTSFLDRFEAKPLKRSTIGLDDGFLDKVTSEIGAATPGLALGTDRLGAYLVINGELRRKNAEELRALATKSAAAFLWKGPFRQQPNSQVMDSFAARRTYVYQGREVDTQDHLGLDLASVRQAPVIAANSGKVLMADYFGIYGNTVIVDHGYGLMSLYAHLSAIEVEPGRAVARGQRLGRTGATGLAGGDHLHFTLLIAGEPVDPLEWFDGKWIADRVASKLGGVLVLEP